MSNDLSSTHPPCIPLGVQVIAWITLVGPVLASLLVISLAHTVPDGNVLFTNQITGHQYVASGWRSLLVAVLVMTAFCAVGALSAFYTLKGRMWGYWVILASLALSVLSPLLRALLGKAHFSLDIVGIILLVVILRDFTGFRDFSMYQARKPEDAERD